MHLATTCRTPTRTVLALLTLSLLALSLLLAACSDTNDASDTSDEPALPTDSSPAPTLAATSTASPEPAADHRRPAPNSTWQWQLLGDLNTSYDVDIYDIDLFDSPIELISQLHSDRRRVVCYFSAGSFEDWREDAPAFQPDDIGNQLDGWEGERWLDVRSPAVQAIMLTRLNLARDKGCDGVEPDNVDGYDNDTGFPLTAEDQLTFNRFLADQAHARGLAIALKNDGAQLPDLLSHYDFALNEQCHEYEECQDLAPLVAAGKAAFNVEYRDSLDAATQLAESICPRANAAGLRTLILTLDLDDAFRISCFDDF